VKVKNPKAPAVTREAEEDWGRRNTSHSAFPTVIREAIRNATIHCFSVHDDFIRAFWLAIASL